MTRAADTAPSLPRSMAWAGLLLLGALLVLAYRPTWEWLAQRYQAADTLYAHGPLVPFASLFVVWRQRRRLAQLRDAGSMGGLLLFLPALLLHLAGVLLRVDSLSGLSLLLLLPGLVWLLGGRALLIGMAFPLAFLVFAWPPPLFFLAEAAQRLKEWVILAAVTVLDLVGSGVVAQGSYLLLPGGGRLLIDDTCSGMRSLVALVALGTFMAGTARDLSVPRRLALLAVSVPVALLANFLRVLLLTTLALAGGVSMAARAHDLSGYGVYVLAIGAYVLLERRLRAPSRVEQAP